MITGESQPLERDQIPFFKRVVGAIRLIHVVPVFTITMVCAALSYFSLDGFKPRGGYILLVLTVFFQECFLGIQNDYLDREQDRLYGKRKAIADGWISSKTALWLSIICYVIFTGLSFGLGYYSKIKYWTVLFIQGGNLIGMVYNLYAKNSPYSLIPYILAFPLAPVLVWLCFGGFDWIYLWYIPMIVFVSFSGHLANELPDFDKDKEYGNRNFTTIIGKKAATIIYWIGAILISVFVIILYFLYDLNTWLFIGTIGLSVIIGVTALIVLWRKNWNTDVQVFNLVTVYLGVNIVGLLFILNI